VPGKVLQILSYAFVEALGTFDSASCMLKSCSNEREPKRKDDPRGIRAW
jgi:hypothetical protein